MKNHDLALTDLPEFRWTLSALLTISMVLFAVIAHNSELTWRLDYEGFNFFVKAFSVPIAVLTSIIPLIGFIALNHRSVQTREQIQLARSQNLFTNYYKHIEEFEKYVSHLYVPLNTINARRAHFSLFPDAKDGNYTPIDIENFDFTASIGKIAFAAINYIENEGKRNYLEFVNKCSHLQQMIDMSYSNMGENTDSSVLVLTATEEMPGIHVYKGLRSLHRTVNGFHKLRAFEAPQGRCEIEMLLLDIAIHTKEPKNDGDVRKLVKNLDKIVEESNSRLQAKPNKGKAHP
ncbi:hypothetical protein RRJ87_002832 [Vibrio parahaemolyticus]|nr:hypothetical protein [Vibrio parahaemolyticus]